MNEESERPIHLAGVSLMRHRHVCALFRTQEQEDKVIIPFLKEGIDRGERAFCISGTEMRTHLLRKLRLAGIEVAMAEKRGQLKMEQWGQTIVRSGRLNQGAMVARLEDILTQGRKQGFGMTRLVGRMEWVREYHVGIYELVEYERRINHILKNFNDPVICAYDLSAFNAGVLVDILRTHPVAIIGDVAAENPFFDPPEVILQELNKRGA
jgi:MEDS: MEthanogen/methylotroph, DcmR Sensory domain